MALDVTAGVPAPAVTVDLPVEGLTKAFVSSAPIFSDVGFSVQRGEAIAIVGANGTGKSTLLRCLLSLIEPNSGIVAVLGQDMTRQRRRAMRALRAQTVLVSQKHNLVPRLSLLSNVLHGLLGQGSGPRYWVHTLAPALTREQAMEALAKVGMSDLALRRADRLSGGQSQRVAIARSLVARPRLLFADESTASLDPAGGEEVMAKFFQLVCEEGVTVVFVSHNIAHALTYGDRVLGLAGGRLELDASASGLKVADLRKLYD